MKEHEQAQEKEIETRRNKMKKSNCNQKREDHYYKIFNHDKINEKCRYKRNWLKKRVRVRWKEWQENDKENDYYKSFNHDKINEKCRYKRNWLKKREW